MESMSAMHICILLVDNNHGSAVRESLLLRLCNYQVVTASCGQEAMHMLQTTQNCFNLVLAAMNLPDIDSFEFIRKVAVEIRLPVVTLLDNYEHAIITKALCCGATLCLMKPLAYNDSIKLWKIPQRRVIRQKRKAEELQSTNGCFIGESSKSAWRPNVNHQLQQLVGGLPRFYSAPHVVAHCNYAIETSNNVLPSQKQQRNLEPTRPCSGDGDELSDTASSAPPVAGQEANEEGSLLSRYLQNYHSRKQLKRLIVLTLNKWEAFPNALSVTPPSPSPPSDVPPISVPLPLAAYIENFMHATMAVGRAPPGYEDVVASKVAAIGPSVLAEFEGCDEELEPGFLAELDTEELFDAIEEFRD